MLEDLSNYCPAEILTGPPNGELGKDKTTSSAVAAPLFAPMPRPSNSAQFQRSSRQLSKFVVVGRVVTFDIA